MRKLSELFELYCNEMHTKYNKEINYGSYFGIKRFIKFSVESCYNDYLNQEIVNDWCIRGAKESAKKYDERIATLRLFLKFSNRVDDSGIILPEKINEKIERKSKSKKKRKRRVTQTEKPFMKSFISDYLEEYVLLLRNSGRYNEKAHNDLIRFNRNYINTYPDSLVFNREMFDRLTDYLFKRTTFCSQSTILNLERFVEYTNFRGYTDILLPNIPHHKFTRQRIPYPFNDDELKLFFSNLDSIPPYKYENDRDYKFRRMQTSTIFRLLFSTGMRTNEARNLKRSNIDWGNSTIEIEQTKGYHQHRIALHPTIVDMLRRYDDEMEKIMCGRTMLFPSIYDDAHKKGWLCKVFNQVWEKMSDEDARPYDFRSNYAVRNINSWKQGEPKWIDKFIYLSRTMGHCDLTSTAYYYQLVPMFREKLEQQTTENLQKIRPNMNDFLKE